jgi:hypothetical protein
MPGAMPVSWSMGRRRVGWAKPVADVGAHLAGAGDEMVPLAGPEPDVRPVEHRFAVEAEEPAHVVGVEVGADHVGDVYGRDTGGAQAGEELTADEVAVGRRSPQPVGSEPGVDEHDAIAGPDEEAADRQPGRVVSVEQLRVGLRRHVAAEVARSCDERPVRDRVQLDVSDPHRRSSLAVTMHFVHTHPSPRYPEPNPSETPD